MAKRFSRENSISKIKKEKAQVYGPQEYESVRQTINSQYEKVEDAYNSYLEGKISGHELARRLGMIVLGIRGEHYSAQVYAFELLLKSLAETKKREDRDDITEEILFDVAYAAYVESSITRIKAEYLLGILAYYSSQELHREREERLRNEPNNQQLIEEVNIFNNLHAALARLFWKEDKSDSKESEEVQIAQLIEKINNKKGNKSDSIILEREVQIAQLIRDDFPRDSDKGEVARLVAAYYSKEPHATRPPEPKTSLILDTLRRRGGEGAGIPWYVYTLPPGKHPSREKIEEADLWGIPLTIGLFKEISDKTRSGVIFDLSLEEARRYIEEMRRLKDQRDYKGIEDLHNKYRDMLWERLDQAARNFFGNKEDTRVLVQTIRDYSIDDIKSGKVNPEKKPNDQTQE